MNGDDSQDPGSMVTVHASQDDDEEITPAQVLLFPTK